MFGAVFDQTFLQNGSLCKISVHVSLTMPMHRCVLCIVWILHILNEEDQVLILFSVCNIVRRREDKKRSKDDSSDSDKEEKKKKRTDRLVSRVRSRNGTQTCG